MNELLMDGKQVNKSERASAEMAMRDALRELAEERVQKGGQITWST
jgi:ubiquitin